MFFNSLKNEEMKRYYRTEYKNDYENMYYAYIEEGRRARDKAIVDFFKNIFTKIFVKSKLSPMEEYLSKASSMEDLEIRQREWERQELNKQQPLFA